MVQHHTWGKLGELCNQYLSKGRQVYVEGRLHRRTYQTQTGETRFVNEINLTDVQFLGGAGGEAASDTMAAGMRAGYAAPSDNDILISRLSPPSLDLPGVGQTQD